MAATPSSLQTASALLKQHYLSPEVIQNVMVPAGPRLTRLLARADTSCGGINIPFPIITAGGGGIGSTYGGAYGSFSASSSQNFLLTRGYTYGIGQIGGEVMEASEAPTDAFVKNLTLEVDVKRRRVHQLMAFYLYGDGTGNLGQISATNTPTVTTPIATLAVPTNAVLFQQGDVVQTSPNANGTSPRAGTLTVQASAMIGPNVGQVTFTTNLNVGIPLIANTDYFFMNGDAASPTIPQGSRAWGPVAGPASSGDNFFGVNRYNNTFLYSQYIDCSATGLNLGGIREALTVVVSQLIGIGSSISAIYLHPVDWHRLSLALQSNGMYPNQPKQGNFGFTSLMLATSGGMIEVFADPFCPQNLAFIQDEEVEEIVGKGEIPHLDEADIGNYFLRVQGIDAYQFQFKAYWQYGNHAPGRCAIAVLPS